MRHNQKYVLSYRKIIQKTKFTMLHTMQSCLSHRIVSGNLFQGPIRNISESTRILQVNIFSEFFFFCKYLKRLDSVGFVHAHSNYKTTNSYAVRTMLTHHNALSTFAKHLPDTKSVQKISQQKRLETQYGFHIHRYANW